MKTPSDLVSSKQAAEITGVGESTVRRWADQGIIKRYKRRWLAFFSLGEIRAALETTKVK